MKLYAVIHINRKTRKEMPPRFDLAPMNHPAACNWMDACRNDYSDYKLTLWPAAVPHPAPPISCDRYRRHQDQPA